MLPIPFRTVKVFDYIVAEAGNRCKEGVKFKRRPEGGVARFEKTTMTASNRLRFWGASKQGSQQRRPEKKRSFRALLLLKKGREFWGASF